MRAAFLLLLLVSLSFASYYIVGDTVEEIPGIFQDGTDYLFVDGLKKLGFDVVGDPAKGVVYLFYGDHIIKLKESGEMVLDFVDVLDGECLFLGSKVYVPIEIVEDLTGKRWSDLPGGGKALFLKKREVLGFEKVGESYYLKFDGTFPEEMVKTSIRGNEVRITVYPLESARGIPENIDWSFENGRLNISILVPKGFKPIFRFGRKVLEIRFVPLVEEFFGKMNIADGVVFKREKVKVNGDELIIDSIEVDIRRAKIVPEISAAGVGSLETIRSMVERTGAVAGVNANYFDPKTSLIVGLLIKDGKPLSAAYGGRPIFVITEDDEAMIGKFFVEFNAILGDTLFLIKGVNTIAKGDVILFTDDYAKPVPKIDGRIYVVGRNGRITEFGYRRFLRSGEYMLSIDGKYSDYLKDLKVGDVFKVKIVSTFDLPIKHAVEAGPLIILNGKPLEDMLTEKHRYGGGLAFYKAARTIVAIRDSKTVVLMMTEGKVTYDEIVDYLKGKGYISAMFLDGGSSSSMVVRDMVFTGNGKERYVASGLLVFPRR